MVSHQLFKRASDETTTTQDEKCEESHPAASLTKVEEVELPVEYITCSTSCNFTPSRYKVRNIEETKIATEKLILGSLDFVKPKRYPLRLQFYLLDLCCLRSLYLPW